MPTSALLPSFSDSRTPVKTLLTCLRFPYYLSLTYLLLLLLFYWRYFLSVEFSVSLILSLPVSILRFIQLMGLSSYLEYGVLWSVILMEEFSFYLLDKHTISEHTILLFFLSWSLPPSVSLKIICASPLLFTMSFRVPWENSSIFFARVIFSRHHVSSQPLNVILHVCLAVSLSPLWWTGFVVNSVLNSLLLQLRKQSLFRSFQPHICTPAFLGRAVSGSGTHRSCIPTTQQ